jgi:thiamine biosynthesis protein ThiC
MIVDDLFVYQAFQRALVQYDHLVEQVAAADAEESFGNAVLPGTVEDGSLRLDANALHHLDHLVIET